MAGDHEGEYRSKERGSSANSLIEGDRDVTKRRVPTNNGETED